MIFVTGDTHGLTNRFNELSRLKNPLFVKYANRGNYLIITGDCGAIWSEATLNKNVNFYSNLGYTILFIDGNNDNMDMLDKFPVQTWHGGKVHKITDNLIHLMRGEIYEIEGKTILAFGGADSWDRPNCDWKKMKTRYFPEMSPRRTEGENWWRRERPSYVEFENMFNNLKKYNNKVDFIITHDTTSKQINKNFDWNTPQYVNHMLDKLYKTADFRHWFFGHHHYTILDIEPCMSCIHDTIIDLDDKRFKQFRSEKINQLEKI